MIRRTIGAVVLLTTAAILAFALTDNLDALRAWHAEYPAWAAVAMTGATVLGTVVAAPVSAFELTAGALFGPRVGFLLMLAASSAGAAITFWVARRGFGQTVDSWMMRRPDLARIHHAMRHRSFWFMVLLRMTPLHAATCNYALAASPVRFWPFLLATLGRSLNIFVTVYMGHLARLVTTSEPSDLWSPLRMVGTAVALTSAILAMVYAGVWFRRALRAEDAACPATTTPHQTPHSGARCRATARRREDVSARGSEM